MLFIVISICVEPQPVLGMCTTEKRIGKRLLSILTSHLQTIEILTLLPRRMLSVYIHVNSHRQLIMYVYMYVFHQAQKALKEQEKLAYIDLDKSQEAKAQGNELYQKGGVVQSCDKWSHDNVYVYGFSG